MFPIAPHDARASAVLNEVTGADRRTLKKILKGATLVCVHANGNLYTLAQAKRLPHRHAQAVVEDRASISTAIVVGVLEHQHAPGLRLAYYLGGKCV